MIERSLLDIQSKGIIRWRMWWWVVRCRIVADDDALIGIVRDWWYGMGLSEKVLGWKVNMEAELREGKERGNGAQGIILISIYRHPWTDVNCKIKVCGSINHAEVEVAVTGQSGGQRESAQRPDPNPHLQWARWTDGVGWLVWCCRLVL